MLKLSPELADRGYRVERLGRDDLEAAMELAREWYSGQEEVQRLLDVPLEVHLRNDRARAANSLSDACSLGVYAGDRLVAMVMNDLYEKETESETYAKHYGGGDDGYGGRLSRFFEHGPGFRASDRLGMDRWLELGFAVTHGAHRGRGLYTQLVRLSEAVARDERGCDHLLLYASCESSARACDRAGMVRVARVGYAEYRDRATGSNPFRSIDPHNPAMYVMCKKLK